VNSVAALNKLKTSVLDLLFPPRCVGCGSEGSFLCFHCKSALDYLPPPLCPRCGIPLPEGSNCYTCKNYDREIDGIRSLFPLNGVVHQAVLQFKYQNVKALAAQLAELMGEYLRVHRMHADILVPVPLHPRRLRERGYNQSSLLAVELGRLTSWPVVEGVLLRIKNTPPQTKTKSAEERRQNVAGAFSCLGRRLSGRHVLLIDDVCTSGATLDSCATALKRAGAASVWGLTLARDI
jgi:competence protein ComFC